MRRYRTMFADFDSRALGLEDPIPENWEPDIKELHIKNRDDTIASLIKEFGEVRASQKIKNFVEIGSKSFSVQSYHNEFYSQARDAFVVGSYYSALLGACALGERILNHLILDLREDFAHISIADNITTAKSFINWPMMLRTLVSWNVIDGEVDNLFRNLSRMRHRSVHFNAGTYSNVRDDALASIIALREIINKQFSSFGTQKWYIEGTLGACFIKKSYERNPFVKKFIVPTCFYVGPYHTMKLTEDFVWQTIDWPPELYGTADITDQQFKEAFNNCPPELRVPTEGEMRPATIFGPDDVV